MVSVAAPTRLIPVCEDSVVGIYELGALLYKISNMHYREFPP